MATAVAPKSTLDALQQPYNESASQDAMQREPRYLFYAGDEPGMPEPGGLQVASRVIKDKILWRCLVTSAVTVPIQMRKEEIPEGRLLDGTLNDRGIASMLLYCGPEVDEMLAQYGHPDPGQWQKRWGLVELTELRGMEPKAVAKLNLTAFFFPNWPDIPETNQEVRAMLEAKITKIRPDTTDERIIKTGEQMLEAVKMAQTYQSRLIREGNIRITYPDTNDGHKPGFDQKDELFAHRSGASLAVNSLRGNQSDAAAQNIGSVVREVIKELAPVLTQPQAATIDPNAVAAIVVATMQALNPPKPEVKEEVVQPPPPRIEVKAPIKK